MIYAYNPTKKDQTIYDLNVKVPAKSSICLSRLNHLSEELINKSISEGTLSSKIKNKFLFITNKSISHDVDNLIEVSKLPVIINKVTTSAKPVKNYDLSNMNFSDEQLNDDEFIKEFLEQEEQTWNAKIK
jgi:hypothetical protein